MNSVVHVNDIAVWSVVLDCVVAIEDPNEHAKSILLGIKSATCSKIIDPEQTESFVCSFSLGVCGYLVYLH